MAAGLAACRQTPENPPAIPDLKAGQIIQGQLSSERPALYRVALSPDQYLHVKLEQQGVDAVLSLIDTDGKTSLLSMDSPNGDRGPEHLFFVAERGGSYLLEARASGEPGGRFLLETESRRAVPMDRLRAAACRALSDADALAGETTTRSSSLPRYEKAIEGWRRSGEVFQEAMTENKLGKAFSALGVASSATRHWERSLALFARLGMEGPQPAIYNNLGIAYQRLGKVTAARNAFETARAKARQQGNRGEEASAVNNLGLLEQGAGEPWRAFLLFEEALAGWRDVGDDREAMTLHNLGTLYMGVGKLPEARESLENALSLYRASGRQREEAATTMALGWVRFLQGDAAGARADLLRSLDLRRAVGDRRGEAVSLDRLGTLSRETGQFEQAISHYRQALKIQEEIGDQHIRALTLINLGAALTAKGEPAAGLHSQDLALSALEGQEKPSDEASARFRRAQANRELGRLEAAWADMLMAIPRLEDIRARAESDDLRMSYLDWVHEQFEFAVDLLMALHDKEPGRGHDRLALEMSERARARSLLDLVHQAGERRTAERMAADSGRLRRLDEEIRTLEQTQAALVAAGGRGGALPPEEPRIRQLLREREKILVELRSVETGGSFSARPLNVKEIQREILDARTVMLVYFLGEKRSFVWTISSEGVESAELPPRALVESAAVRFHSLLTRSHLRGIAGQLRLTATELSAVLLGKVAHRLKGKRIVVVADGALAYVPFGALPNPAGGGQPMIIGHEVSMTPSVSVLAAIRERAANRPLPSGLVAVVADPVFSRDDPRVTLGVRQAQSATLGGDVVRSARDLGLGGLERLPFSGREAEAILALVRPDQGFRATDFSANLPLVTEGSLEDFRIVHFATHALVHPKYPELSGVVLSLVDEQGRPRPGFLRSHQIHSLHLPADLVVLSACQTGLGLELQGEGLVGLTQSFFNAGASRVVVSLWNVGDEATAQLMDRFYREHLQRDLPPSAALRAAQLSMLRDPRWSAPRHWAGFVLQGDFR